MAAPLSIGDFSRATHMSLKALRHYHRLGLLVPEVIDPGTGYRRYGANQIRDAQVISRFRQLGMPLAEIRALLEAPTLQGRQRLITGHLDRLEGTMHQTAAAVASLRDLLAGPPPATAEVTHRSQPETLAAGISDVLDLALASVWYQGAIGELLATIAAQGVAPAGPPGGIYDGDLFARERGPATLFIPVDREVIPAGRVRTEVVPAAELAVIVHRGGHDGIDRSYGALAEHVASRALAVEGPTREYYLAGRHNSADPADWRTEIGWPIFRTGA
jgi:DNA-binding transcriptional MerR regulator